MRKYIKKIKRYIVKKINKNELKRKKFRLLSRINPKLNIKSIYKYRFGKKINLKNPKTFNEKINYLKLNEYSKNNIYSLCADKIQVREYIKKLGYEKILIPSHGIYKDVNEINFNKLPNKFVMKWNFGCGTNYICKDKKLVNKDKFYKQLKKWKNNKFYLVAAEMHYKKIKKGLICEKYIGDDNTLPQDYKFYCFNGKAEYVMICSERETKKPKFCFFDRDWNLCRLNKQSLDFKENYTVEKPKLMDKMFKIADDLSKDFKFVRVDLYNINNKIYFGELTFTPCAGLDTGYTLEGDILLGSKIKL